MILDKMSKRMFLAFWLCSVLIAMPLDAKDNDTAKTLAAKKVAQKLIDATNQGHYAALIDHTYETAVKQMGGCEKAIKMIERLMKQIKKWLFGKICG